MNHSFDDDLYKFEINSSRYPTNNDFNFLIQETKDYTPTNLEFPYNDHILYFPQQDPDEKSLQQMFPSFMERKNSLSSDGGIDIQYQEPEEENQINENDATEKEKDNTNPQKIKFVTNKKAFNKNSLLALDYNTYIVMVFLFSLFNKGRMSSERKSLDIYTPKHPKDALDNAKKKVFRRCFKVIGKVIRNLCSKIRYKFFGSNHKFDLKNENIVKYCKRTMEYYLKNNIPKIGSKEHDRKLYNEMKLDEKFEEAILLQNILKTSLGEVLIKFLEDDNFVKSLDPLNNDFSTFSDHFANEYDELRKDTILRDLKKLAYKSQIDE